MKLQAEIKRINDDCQKQKAELQAQEKLADHMVMEFTKKKMVGTCFLTLRTCGQEWGEAGLRTEGTLMAGSPVFF